MNTHNTGKTSFITYFLIAICLSVFAVELYLGEAENTNALLILGAKYNPAIDSGEYWRLIAPIFLHVGIRHLILNMLSLWFMGRHSERIYGHSKFLLLFLLSGIAGNAASYTFNPHALSAGASTSIYGVMGALLILLIMRRSDSYAVAVARPFIPLAVINIATNFLPGSGVDVAGHFGGLACGLVMGALLIATKRKSTPFHKDSNTRPFRPQYSNIKNRPSNQRPLPPNPYKVRLNQSPNCSATRIKRGFSKRR